MTEPPPHRAAPAQRELFGMTAVVTGANSGIGLAVSRALAQGGAAVVLACRDTGRGARAAEALRAETGNDQVQPGVLDLASLRSIRSFASTLTGPLDLLINNAGGISRVRRETSDGFELQFGVHHLGHFALTGLLLPRLAAASAARVVTVSSVSHRYGRIDFTDLSAERGYRPWQRYFMSKLANLVFTAELGRRLTAADLPVTAMGAHPGLTDTNFLTGGYAAADLLGGLFRALVQPAGQGALPVLHAALAPEAAQGDCYAPSGRLQLRGSPVRIRPAPRALDQETGTRLWDASCALTGVRYLQVPA